VVVPVIANIAQLIPPILAIPVQLTLLGMIIFLKVLR
jgi:hypothetical protein